MKSFIEEFAYKMGCHEDVFKKLYNNYAEYISMIEPQRYVTQCDYSGNPEHNRYNHQILVGLTFTESIDLNQSYKIISTLIIHDYGRISLSHQMENFIRNNIN